MNICDDNEMSVETLARKMRDSLAAIYGPGEAKAMVGLIFHALKGWNQTALVVNGQLPASRELRGKCAGILRRLALHEPIQYILGEACFYGLNLKVDRSTLIPRPETEQLVDIIVKENSRPDLRLLDVGTGSGAIAIALARNLNFPQITAIDISAEALKVARENARTLHAHVDFVEQDIFRYSPGPDSFDIIVSNPPYIDASERAAMERNVLDYEPHQALFVPDDNPLLYYSRISAIARTALCRGGRLYFEINPRHASELAGALRSEGFSDVETIEDFRRTARFIRALRPV